MSTPLPDERMRARAERSLRFRSAILGAIFKVVGFLIVLSWIFALLTWLATPGLIPWLQGLASQLASSTSTDAAVHIKMQLLSIPGGFPWPLIWMLVSAFVGSLLRGLLGWVFNYADFERIDAATRMYDRAIRREMRRQQVREGIINPFLEMLSDYGPTAEMVRDEFQRRFDKVRRWIQMYNEVPDTVEPVMKAKGKPKRDQMVRLSDDGELVFEDEPLHDVSASGLEG